jgi:hypothetical protein
MEKNEPVTITYKNDKITMTGKTFTAVLSISGSELSKVYWGNVGKGTVKMVLEDGPAEKKPVPEAKKEEVSAPVTKATPPKTVETPKPKKPDTTSNSDLMKNFNR